MGGLIHAGAWIGEEYRVGNGRRKILFEPQAAAFAQLETAMRLHVHTVCVNCALGAEPGEAVMNTAHPSHSSSLLAPRPDDHPFGAIRFEGQETVRMSTLDIEMAGRDDYDTLIVDTQGYELEVLKGGVETLKSVNRIEIEVHRPSSYPGAASLEALDAFLIPLGFTRTAYDQENSDDLGDAVYERLA